MKFIAFLYRTDTKVEIMFKFTSKFSDDFKTDASSILRQNFPSAIWWGWWQILRRSIDLLFLSTIVFCFRVFCEQIFWGLSKFSDEKLAENFEN